MVGLTPSMVEMRSLIFSSHTKAKLNLDITGLNKHRNGKERTSRKAFIRNCLPRNIGNRGY